MTATRSGKERRESEKPTHAAEAPVVTEPPTTPGDPRSGGPQANLRWP